MRGRKGRSDTTSLLLLLCGCTQQRRVCAGRTTLWALPRNSSWNHSPIQLVIRRWQSCRGKFGRGLVRSRSVVESVGRRRQVAGRQRWLRAGREDAEHRYSTCRSVAVGGMMSRLDVVDWRQVRGRRGTSGAAQRRDYCLAVQAGVPVPPSSRPRRRRRLRPPYPPPASCWARGSGRSDGTGSWSGESDGTAVAAAVAGPSTRHPEAAAAVAEGSDPAALRWSSCRHYPLRLDRGRCPLSTRRLRPNVRCHAPRRRCSDCTWCWALSESTHTYIHALCQLNWYNDKPYPSYRVTAERSSTLTYSQTLHIQ